MLQRIGSGIARRYRARPYYFWRVRRHNVPVHPLSCLPDGFAVHQVAETGVSVVDNFCTSEEARYLIDKARPLLMRSTISIHNKAVEDQYRTSRTASVYNPISKDPALLPLLYRGAMLLGVPHLNVETIFVTHYAEGEYYKGHEDFYPGFDGDRLYTILIYLNDVAPDQGGETVFEHLKLAVQPKLGRAVCWTNRNPDGSGHPETRHAAAPLKHGGEKWVIQLWFRRYALLSDPAGVSEPPQCGIGIPLTGDEVLPDGASAPGPFESSAVFGDGQD